MFFFPEAMLSRAQECDGNKSFKGTKALINEFNSRCREYLGFGYFASFFRGTEAYKARIALSSIVAEIVAATDSGLQDISNIDSDNNIKLFKRWGNRALLRGVIVDKLLLGPLWRIFDANFSAHLNIRRISKNRLAPLEKIALYFPILSSLNKPEGKRLSNLVHDLCNPLRLVDNMLKFLNSLVNRIVEIGSEEYPSLNFIRAGLKGFIGIVFFAVATPVKIGIKLLDIPFDIVKAVVYNPLKFIFLSIYDRCKRGSDPVAKAGSATKASSPRAAGEPSAQRADMSQLSTGAKVIVATSGAQTGAHPAHEAGGAPSASPGLSNHGNARSVPAASPSPAFHKATVAHLGKLGILKPGTYAAADGIVSIPETPRGTCCPR